MLLSTASQLGRAAVEEIEYDHHHIAGGISKINTADNVFGIFTSRAMRERGKYQLQLMKTETVYCFVYEYVKDFIKNFLPAYIFHHFSLIRIY